MTYLKLSFPSPSFSIIVQQPTYVSNQDNDIQLNMVDNVNHKKQQLTVHFLW